MCPTNIAWQSNCVRKADVYKRQIIHTIRIDTVRDTELKAIIVCRILLLLRILCTGKRFGQPPQLRIGQLGNRIVGSPDSLSLIHICEIYPHDITVEELKALPNVKGIIINGGPNLSLIHIS